MTATSPVVTTLPHATDARRREALDGIRTMAPVLVAYLPFGLLVGAGVAASASPWAAWAGTWTIYGGAAHVAVLDALAQGSGWATAALVGLVVNARLAAYATAMVPAWRSASAWRRLVAAVMLTDAPWALSRERSRHFYLGAAVTLFVTWPVMVTAGVLVGGWLSVLPVAALVVPLTLGVVVVPQLRSRPVAAVVVAASVSAVVTAGWSAGIGLGVAAFVGAVAGLLAGRAS